MFPHKATKIMNLYVLILLFFFPRFRLMLFPFFSSFFGSLSFVVSVFSRQITFFFFLFTENYFASHFSMEQQANIICPAAVRALCGLTVMLRRGLHLPWVFGACWCCSGSLDCCWCLWGGRVFGRGSLQTQSSLLCLSPTQALNHRLSNNTNCEFSSWRELPLSPQLTSWGDIILHTLISPLKSTDSCVYL